MATAARLIAALLSFGCLFVSAPGQNTGAATAPGAQGGLDGREERLRPTNRPTVEAAFPRESYAPGTVARLVIWTRGTRVSLQIFRAGTEVGNVRARDVM